MRYFITLISVLSIAVVLRADDDAGNKTVDALRIEWHEAANIARGAMAKAKTAEEEKAAAELFPDAAAFAARYLKVAEDHPGTRAEVIAFFWVAFNDPKSPAGKATIDKLVNGRIKSAVVADLADAIVRARTDRSTRDAALISPILELSLIHI